MGYKKQQDSLRKKQWQIVTIICYVSCSAKHYITSKNTHGLFHNEICVQALLSFLKVAKITWG